MLRSSVFRRRTRCALNRGSLDDSTVGKIIAWLTADKASEQLFADHLPLLKQVVPLARQEEGAIFGEALPAGLVIH